MKLVYRGIVVKWSQVNNLLFLTKELYIYYPLVPLLNSIYFYIVRIKAIYEFFLVEHSNFINK